MIAWEPEYRLVLKKKMFTAAHARGIPFELCVGHYTQRGGATALVSNGHVLAGCATKGRTGCVVSSGAACPAQVRAPQDMAALRVALGATHEDAWAAPLLAARVRDGRLRSVLEAGMLVFTKLSQDDDDDNDE